MDQETLLLKIYEEVQDTSNQLASLHSTIEAYDVPKLVDRQTKTEKEVVELNTKVHTWAGIAGLVGTVFGAIGLKGIDNWLRLL